MNSTINPYDISGFRNLNPKTNLQGTIFSVANPSQKTVPLPKGSIITWEQALLREETVLSILIRPSNDPQVIPVATKYGQIFTSRSNLVEAVKIAPDISEGIPISLLLEIADEAGIDVPASYRIQIEQWISQGKGNQTTKGKVLDFQNPSQTDEYLSSNSSDIQEVQSQDSSVAQEDQSPVLTSSVENADTGKVILVVAAAIAIGGFIYLSTSNPPKKKQKPNQAKNPSK